MDFKKLFLSFLSVGFFVFTFSSKGMSDEWSEARACDGWDTYSPSSPVDVAAFYGNPPTTCGAHQVKKIIRDYTLYHPAASCGTITVDAAIVGCESCRSGYIPNWNRTGCRRRPATPPPPPSPSQPCSLALGLQTVPTTPGVPKDESGIAFKEVTDPRYNTPTTGVVQCLGTRLEGSSPDMRFISQTCQGQGHSGECYRKTDTLSGACLMTAPICS